MNRLLNSDSLSSMFGIEMVDGTDDIAKLRDTVDSKDYLKTVCVKCKGKGRFIGYTGRVVGNCFACNGTGLDRAAGVEVAEGDCVKCLGTGEWRPGRPCFACNSTGKVAGSKVAAISVDAIEKALTSAFVNGIKRPKLRLDTFIFSRAPDHGVNAGSLYVKMKSGEYLGKVTEGQFKPTMTCDAVTTAKVIEVAADPHNAAKAYGAKTGECACCGRELTNGESIRLGIGPICIQKFGW